ncbi:2,3-bisphosphoglycerate-dependent phosphoglycerate mutase [Aplysia californica]|uniref:Phosphoglycerate mutase n=1 Tax=Aplysia californica TaxID=6500 RepID=A0ABM1VTD3_APLCA|nr:2,3-bisphosphoglycerate-dependent phosphoglycerate mutase [Aplysia californica]XP_012938015.1 2,3-bisphosphoglycerate-dependent phosphoglycerate mutase [Aplysia californica]XP_012938024.1 2,3-bisphosphoglycerate-dependent phosphoglycerate mutase [Aplysia californica]XP_012938028.1 2,3-bisphosphoglycerate-dependent phosphoglycerate mutase [Aplysia californica]XP_035825671.1 2,3-bisphosphoglycerate-dependent phosphoglycerate mutase [Aplysia californica]XP_035825675.1 2,3-bisphosphoglycerate-d
MTSPRYNLVLVRHGESTYNRANLFTGWHDADLSDTGVKEAIYSGQLLKRHGFDFDIAFTSVLKRAVKTLHFIQEELDALWVPVVRSWRLNERHYGILQGLNKASTVTSYGEEQVHKWRRSFRTAPPALEPTDDRSSQGRPPYTNLEPGVVPATESLQDAMARCLPFWYDHIAPAIKSGKRVLIASHENTLRGLITHLGALSNTDCSDFRMPNAIPLVCELDEDLHPIRHYFLATPEEMETARTNWPANEMQNTM